MKIISIQEAYQRKRERQKRIRKLEYHAGGHCVHIGGLSPGCYGCFVFPPFRLNVWTGVRCNLKCHYCYGPGTKPLDKRGRLRIKKAFLLASRKVQRHSLPVGFSGAGEPLMDMKIIQDYMKIFKDLENGAGRRPWYYIYTHGLLAEEDPLKQLRDFGIDEIRFHLGASNFSQRVYQNMKNAVGLFKTVAVETPAWPPHRRKLLEMLPIIEDLGVKHLNLEEVGITSGNYKSISSVLPEGEMYRCYGMYLYDGGLVYDLMEESIRRRYSFSILDCCSWVNCLQKSPALLSVSEGEKGMIAED